MGEIDGISCSVSESQEGRRRFWILDGREGLLYVVEIKKILAPAELTKDVMFVM